MSAASSLPAVARHDAAAARERSAFLAPDVIRVPPPVLVMLDCAGGRCVAVDADEPQLRITDLAATRGDGVFETLLAHAGVVRKPAAHLQRMAASAASAELRMPAPTQWLEAMALALRVHGCSEEALVKLVLTRGPEGEGVCTAWVHVVDASGTYDQARSSGIDVVVLDRGYDCAAAQRAPWLMLGAKTLSYAVNMAALRHARTHGAQDVIFFSSDGWVLEGPTSTVVMARDIAGQRTLVTPPHDCGILAGTTQQALFDAAAQAGWRVEYAPLRPSELLEGDGLWLVSSGRLLAPVNRIDGQAVSRRPALDRELLALILAGD